MQIILISKLFLDPLQATRRVVIGRYRFVWIACCGALDQVRSCGTGSSLTPSFNVLSYPSDPDPTVTNTLAKVWRRSSAARGGDGRSVAVLVKQEAREEGSRLTEVVVGWGSSTCGRRGRGRTGTVAIARRRLRRRRVVLSAVEGDAVDHPEAKQRCG